MAGMTWTAGREFPLEVKRLFGRTAFCGAHGCRDEATLIVVGFRTAGRPRCAAHASDVLAESMALAITTAIFDGAQVAI